MSRIFLSHANPNTREALALKVWLESQGWKDEIFLALDPESGIKSGTRWKEALAQANERCEAIICLISPEWVNSDECGAEYRTAEYLRKTIFVAQIAELGSTDSDKTREWQGCRLFGEGLTTEITLGPQHQPVRFLAEGLACLKNGLLEAGISGALPKHFPWPPQDEPNRAPYRGLEPLEWKDAGIYFGRDAEILSGLAELEHMRLEGDAPIFVILGASGAGKSSFLRAGLLPRLARDDRRFLPLEVIRPERSPLYGERGLAHAIYKANSHLNLAPGNLGDIKAGLKEGAERFAALLHNIQQAAYVRLLGLPVNTPPPTLILPVDQAEELFNADATEEARAFLKMIRSALRRDSNGAEMQPVPMIVAFTIRSDRYEPLQTAPELTGLKTVVFDALRPMPPAQFKEIILGPADRTLVNGKRLDVKPALVNQLLADCAKGADPLPVLGLTLARLYRDYGSDGDLQLTEYTDDIGGMANIIKTEAESILAEDPETRGAQLALLHVAFIPGLATINTINNEPMRRRTPMSDLPEDSRSLIQALIEKRLLLSDKPRKGEQVVEVAHESLLRQWDVLAAWLKKEGDDLKEADRLEEDTQAWAEKGKNEAWLREGERLDIGEKLAAKPAYRKRLEPVSEFLLKSRQRETQRREEEERVRQRELVFAQEQQKSAEDKQRAAEDLAAEQSRATERAQADATRLKKRGKQLMSLVAFAVVVAVIAGGFYWKAEQASKRAEQQFKQATALRLNAEAQAMLSGTRSGGPIRGLSTLLAAHRIAPNNAQIDGALLTQLITFEHLNKIIETGAVIYRVAFDPYGIRLVSSGFDGTVRLWNAQTGEPLGAPLKGHKDGVHSVAFSPDGTRLVSGGADGTVRLWNTQTGEPLGAPLKGHGFDSVAFSPDGTRLVSVGLYGTLRLWDAQTGEPIDPIDPPLKGHENVVNSVAFSPDGTRLVSGSEDGTLRLWTAPKAWPDILCAKLTSNMGRNEWHEQVSPDIVYHEQCPGLPIPPDATEQQPTTVGADEGK